MIRTAALLALLASSTCSALAHGIAPVPSTFKLTAVAPGVLRNFPVRPVQLKAARGEWECFQIMVRADERPIKALKLKATTLATQLGRFIGRDNVQIFRESFVFVPRPSGNAELKPLWWSDALIPLGDSSTSTCEARRAIAFWVAVRTPPEAEPGEYYGALDFDIDGEPRTLAVTLDAEKISLPAPTMRGTVAVYYDVLRDWYRKAGHEFSDAQWDEQKRAYYDFLLGYRVNAYDLPVPWDDARALKYLQDPRVTAVRLPPLGSPAMPRALKALDDAHAKQKAFYYRIDEPTPPSYPQVLEATRQLHQLDPELKHLVTIHPNNALQDAVDIWCPNIGDATGLGWLDFARLAHERKAGRETWWYTMAEPRFPYPTWLVDDDAPAVRCYGALMARWGINGFVYSMAHGWGPDPFKSLQSFADTSGDGTLLYPGELVGLKGPIPSIRLMLLRDAIEDYELLKLLPLREREFVADTALAGLPRQEPRRAILQNRADVAAGLSPWHAFVLASLSDKAEALKLRWLAQQQRFPEREAEAGAILAAPTPRIDGTLSPREWSADALSAISPINFKRGFLVNDPIKWPETVLYLSRDAKYLYAALRARSSPQVLADQWFAIEAAPEDTHEKWRFVVTAKHQLIVEKYTREGRLRAEDSEFKGALKQFSGYTDVEMAIPLSLLPDKAWRLNALRRVTHSSGAKVILRAFDDAGDARAMPLFGVK